MNDPERDFIFQHMERSSSMDVLMEELIGGRPDVDLVRFGVTESGEIAAIPIFVLPFLFTFFPFISIPWKGREGKGRGGKGRGGEGRLALISLILYAVPLAPHSLVPLRPYTTDPFGFILILLHLPDVEMGGSLKTGETSDSTPEPPKTVEYPSRRHMEQSNSSLSKSSLTGTVVIALATEGGGALVRESIIWPPLRRLKLMGARFV